MWLVDTDNYTLREVYNAARSHPYGILSHTWDEPGDDPYDGEVTFQDMQDHQKAQTKSGWEKIRKTCELAKAVGLKWVWIDTCCIDKTSSAELTEAINSMFRWYRESTVCFAYLKDLPAEEERLDVTYPNTARHRKDDFYFRALFRALSQCRWFSRGWTLQELIAPACVKFYDGTWTKCGTKSTLEKMLCSITGIDAAVLRDSEELSRVPVGRRMSWASKRSTKRIEDTAYSLFGIFDVNMPLIYGEGHKAFLRLQEIIIRQTRDLTLFAWRSSTGSDIPSLTHTQIYYGIFAQSPADFTQSSHIVSIPDPVFNDTCTVNDVDHALQFYTIFNTPHIERGPNDLDTQGDYLMHLCCEDIRAHSKDAKAVAVRLVKTDEGFARIQPDKLYYVINQPFFRGFKRFHTFSIPKYITPQSARDIHKRYDHAFRFCYEHPVRVAITCNATLCNPLDNSDRMEVANSMSQNWEFATATFLTRGSPIFTGLLTPRIVPRHIEKLYSLNWRIVCGLRAPPQRKRGSGQKTSTDLIPWVTLVCTKDDPQLQTLPESYAFEKIHLLELYLKQFVSYTAAASHIGAKQRTKLATGGKCCTAAILLPRSQQARGSGGLPEEALLLGLSVETLEENGHPVHEVTVRLEHTSKPYRSRKMIQT